MNPVETFTTLFNMVQKNWSFDGLISPWWKVQLLSAAKRVPSWERLSGPIDDKLQPQLSTKDAFILLLLFLIVSFVSNNFLLSSLKREEMYSGYAS